MFKSLLFFITLFLIAGLSQHNSETLVLLCFGYIGILTHYVKKWSEKLDKNEDFNLRKAIPSIILSLIATTVLVFIRAEIVNLFVFTKGSSFLVGYCGNSWLFGLIDQKIHYTNPNITKDES